MVKWIIECFYEGVHLLNLQQLLEIYPYGTVQSMPDKHLDKLSLPIENKWLILPLSELSPSEEKLLRMIYLREQEVKVDYINHPWYPYLFENSAAPNKPGYYRVLQFRVLPKDPKLSLKDWHETLISMFPSVTDSFFIDEQYGLLIEEKTKETYSPEELEEIFLTIDTELDCKTSAYIGSFFPNDTFFAKLFEEEQQVFLEEKAFIKGQVVFDLPTVALHFFTKKSLAESAIIRNIRSNLTLDNELKEIILSLWQNQGNISSTAKYLFMHRNTLQYRLERFHEQTGLNLKKMDHLILCYLIIS